MSKSAAVCVRDVVKSYRDKRILDGLSMTVERGTIYGLLGASGCGKTTLLSCIVGRKSYHSGEIWVLGGTPGEKGSGVPGPRVGYMPQDIALVGEFTVKDAVFYFGRILNMEDKLILERFKKLSVLLELPPEDRYLKNCSGGQQRRVSFAAAMVHMPELLILDEPTVGVDPVLRDRIWNYLVEIVQTEKTAVIITTHYIEEAKQADKIGLMRGGKLLAEESPARLLQLFQVESLEEAFLILSRNQEEGRINSALEGANRSNGTTLESASSTTSVANSDVVTYGSKDELTKEKKKTKIKKDKTSIEPHRIRALLDKNWKQFYRNITGIVFLITFPLLQTLCFLNGVGGDVKGLKLGIVNDETMTTRCPDFNVNGTTQIHDFSDCYFSNMSCRFLEYLEHPMIHKVKFDGLDEATQAIKHGEILGVLYMAKNFTKSYENRVEKGKDAENYMANFGEIKAYLDMSNRQTGATLKYKLYELFYDFQEAVFRECGWPERLGNLPLRQNFIYGNEDESYTVYMIPGTLVTMLFFMGSMMTSQIIITDRKEGVWDRSIVAGVTSLEITLTHFILQALIMVVQSAEVLVMVFWCYQYSFVGNFGVITFLTYLSGICGMAYGFWVSVICEDHSQANISVSGGFLPMMLLCGLIWPTEAMPLGLRIFAKCLPFTLAIESLRNVIKKGWPVWDPQVLHGMGVLVIWIFMLGLISVWLMKLKR
ncbi:ABC transporter G family member 23-like isoform X2 [Anthonomus grandis grandis]|nr:ABC transporter G family member 23-like isoform X2 [Anthonomus grandis grandis]XP_050310196.1 ABC transporter G family member 23-like isoform X2 [Anthonomus grandis grandis]XP_050310197.1 ABC transporter G family member 23-like isoform X2 [Anthonomus grandis grandis]